MTQTNAQTQKLKFKLKTDLYIKKKNFFNINSKSNKNNGD